MKDNKDEMISGFLHSYRKEIEDNGFSERVIKNLPERKYDISKILDVICITISIILFVASNGFTIIYNSVVELINSQSLILSHNLHNTSLLIAFVVLFFIGLERIYSMKW